LSFAARHPRLRAAVAWAVAALALVWVLHDVHPAVIARSIIGLKWQWAAAAVALDILSYAVQGLRWRLLLAPAGRVSTLEATRAIYAGLFTSEILPLRFGELVRAYLIARRVGKPFLSVVPSMALERLFDAVWLAVAISATAILMPLPPELMRAADILGVTVLAATAFFLWIVLRPANRGPGSRFKTARRIAELAAELRAIGKEAPVIASFTASLLIPVSQAASFWFAMLAYGLSAGLWAGVVTYLIVRLGTLIPNTPANVGTYQFFTVVGLRLFGVTKTAAGGFSIVVFLLLTVPLWALGSLALARSGTTLTAVRKELSGQQQPATT
jgi:uncharacterized protein (TIRG00374 family)